MEIVTVSRRHEIVIPPAIREALGVRVGQKMQVFQYCGRIELIPVRPMRTARGLIKGIDPSVPRDRDRPSGR